MNTNKNINSCLDNITISYKPRENKGHGVLEVIRHDIKNDLYLPSFYVTIFSEKEIQKIEETRERMYLRD